MPTVTKFIWNQRVLSIVNNGLLTQREKTGHLNSLISWDNNNGAHLDQLLHWITGIKNIPPYMGAFDTVSRVFRLSFAPKVYFEGGGKEFHALLLGAMTDRHWPYISYHGAGYWVGYFPHFEKIEVPEEAAKPVVENKPVVEQVQEEPKPEETVKAPKAKAAPKSVRNMARKKKTEVYTINPDEMDADE